MTIGIGVLATEGAVKPDTLVLVSDTLGSALEDTASTQRLHKMFVSESDGLYAVAADNINNAGELFPRIQHFLRRETTRSHGSIFLAIHSAVHDYHRWRIGKEVLPKYSWIAGDLEAEETKELVRDECMRFNLGCELIVGAFDDSGMALLFETYSVGHTDHEDGAPPTMVLARGNTIPGFTVIGKGRDSADFWLNYRNHALSYSPRRAAYHAYEAKRMAENSPYVNDKIELLIANKTGHVRLDDKTPVKRGWSLEEMREMFSNYGPRSTDGLDRESLIEKRDDISNRPQPIRHSSSHRRSHP